MAEYTKKYGKITHKGFSQAVLEAFGVFQFHLGQTGSMLDSLSKVKLVCGILVYDEFLYRLSKKYEM